MTLEHLSNEVAQIEILLNRGNIAEAETQASVLLNNPMLKDEQGLHIRVLLALSASLWKRRSAKDVLPTALEALSLAENYFDKNILVKALLHIGVLYQQLSDYTKALEMLYRSLALAEKLGDKLGVSNSITNIGSVFIARSDYPKALEYLHRSLALSQELGDKNGEIVCTGNIGIVYRQISDYRKALEYYHIALALSEEHGDKRGVAKSTGNLGVVYNEISDYPKALEYSHHALALSEELGEKSSIARNKCHLAHVYNNLADYPKALEYLHQAVALFEELGQKSSVATNMGNIGAVYSSIPNNNKAFEYFYRAMVLNEELGNKKAVAINGGNIGTIYADEKFEGYDPIKAETFLLNAIAMNKELGVKRTQSLHEKSLSDLYKTQRRWEECLQHFEMFYELEKELQIEEAKKKADQLNYERLEAERDKQRAVARAKHEATEQLLHNVLPPIIAHRMLDGATLIAEKLPAVSVLFADIVGFTRLSQHNTPEQILEGLNRIFTEFDTLAEKHGLEKIKTIGDCYMVAAGAPVPRQDHAQAIGQFALEMQETIKQFKAITTGEQIQLRIGIHTGEVVAGVIGKKKFTYDLWGDTVNTASRMESHGEAGKIHVSYDFANALIDTAFQFTKRGQMEVKGKGMMTTYFLEEQLKNMF